MRQLLILLVSGLLLTGCSTPQKVKIVKQIVRDTIIIKEKPLFKSAKTEAIQVNSNFFPARGKDFRQKHLIIHYTALDFPTSARVLTQQEVSAHYLVDSIPNNQVYILVSEDERAWHAGVSYWKGRNNLNDSSIGIEIVNKGYKTLNNQKVFNDFDENQITTVALLMKDIIQRYEIEPFNVIGHSDVAPQRKYDPGPKFPWQRLYEEYNIGAWYNEETKNFYQSQYPFDQFYETNFILSLQEDLNIYGYEIQKTGKWDEQTQKVIAAFQMHFRPSNYNGLLDSETWAILKALNAKYRTK